jgi:hypothetical protein
MVVSVTAVAGSNNTQFLSFTGPNGVITAAGGAELQRPQRGDHGGVTKEECSRSL